MAPIVLVAIIAIIVLWAGASAQSDCTTALISLSPCLNYVSGNDSTPSSSCCSQLANVVRSQPRCLCTIVNGGGSSLGITINQTRALALPGACKVQTPPVSRCNAGGAGPSASPMSPRSPSTPGAAAPSGGGSKTVPSRDLNSGSSSANVPFSVFFSFLFVAAYISAPLAGS
ncbi:non-specific lipid-transfer protein-like protein [Iris pallida]|uniref:LRR receptor-like serine/threonine-protein kinase n=1 Tax=Iris pallida TaxID=29817 RepID=A0AAX6HSS0_IRIPA|nr:putative LRR receptor-like serine/threonine-protein kinase [Iris pallida]KAJ6844116.1 non-specific lipid-transfer protein-like protein [Iris pallida]